MESYAWPGNVRELRNIVERLAILCDHDRIEPRHLPEEIRQVQVRAASGAPLPRTWEEFKRLKQQVRDCRRAATGAAVPARRSGALRRQRQPCRRGNRHPANQSARLVAEAWADFVERILTPLLRPYSVWLAPYATAFSRVRVRRSASCLALSYLGHSRLFARLSVRDVPVWHAHCMSESEDTELRRA